MRFITTATTTAPFHGVTTLQAWRAAARARGRTPNLAYMQGRFRSAYIDPHRTDAVFDLLSADPRRRKRAIKKQCKLIAHLTRFLVQRCSATTTRWDAGQLTEVSLGGVEHETTRTRRKQRQNHK